MNKTPSEGSSCHDVTPEANGFISDHGLWIDPSPDKKELHELSEKVLPRVLEIETIENATKRDKRIEINDTNERQQNETRIIETETIENHKRVNRVIEIEE